MITEYLNVLNTVIVGYANRNEGCRVKSNANMAVDLILCISNLNSALLAENFLHETTHYFQNLILCEK